MNPNKVLRPYEPLGSAFSRKRLIDRACIISVYMITYDGIPTWNISSSTRKFPTKSEAIAHADKIVIASGYTLIDDEETLNKYLLLI